MGGLGKSTLAHKVYAETIWRYRIHAWVTVSQTYSVVDLLRSIYKQFNEALEYDSSFQVDDTARDLKSITEKLRTFLKINKHSYMVVLDDVWEVGPLINCISAALPANTNDDSRMLMTTRDKDIATSWTVKLKGHMYELKPLQTDEAWELFCKKSFGNADCPAELKLVAYEIMKKCEGLPLVLEAVGGLLSTKKTDYSEWRKLRDTLGSEFGKNRHLKSSTRILLLSYQELPFYLKPCFLYFGMFPEDYSIDCMRLVRLWIAEGFIESCRGKTLEEVALEYLSALVTRNLVQVQRIDETGRCRGFRIHDVLREIILLKLEESGFSQVTGKDNKLMNTHFRRLSIHSNLDESIQFCSTVCNIRTVLLFDNQQMSSFITSFQPKLFRFLRVLDLQDALVYVIPDEVGDLRNLHFLSLRNTKVQALPKSTGYLSNLQTLDLKSSNVTEIPSEAKYLCKLRHLLGYSHLKISYGLEIIPIVVPVGVLEKFQELQKLAFIDGSQRSLLIELRNLKQLTRLGIAELPKENGFYLCRAIEEMKHLRSLSVLSSTSAEVLDLETLIRPPQNLERLYLTGCLKKLPNWIAMLNNLVKLELRDSSLKDDPVEMLQGMANLVHLELYKAYDGEVLDFGQDGFKKLKMLCLFDLPHLRSIKGSLPSIQHMRRQGCHKLSLVPCHLGHYMSTFTPLEESVPFEIHSNTMASSTIWF